MGHIYIDELNAAPSGRNCAAVPIGRYQGKPYYRVPVLIRENNSRACRTEGIRWLTVYARGAAAAADYVRDRITRPETEIIAIGPKGGEAHRYVGWHSAIARAVLGAGRGPCQLRLI